MKILMPFSNSDTLFQLRTFLMIFSMLHSTLVIFNNKYCLLQFDKLDERILACAEVFLVFFQETPPAKPANRRARVSERPVKEEEEEDDEEEEEDEESDEDEPEDKEPEEEDIMEKVVKKEIKKEKKEEGRDSKEREPKEKEIKSEPEEETPAEKVTLLIITQLLTMALF